VRVVILSLLLAGCARPVPGAPEDAVAGLFAALAAKDCDALSAQVAGGLAERLKKDGCAALLKDVGGLRLERIESSTVDGRDPHAWLVRVRVLNRPEPVLFRVDARTGRWAVVAL
jgi:hypothetical protein